MTLQVLPFLIKYKALKVRHCFQFDVKFVGTNLRNGDADET